MRFYAILPPLLAKGVLANRPLFNQLHRIQDVPEIPRRIRKDELQNMPPPLRNLRVDKRDKFSMSMPSVPVFSFLDETEGPSTSPIQSPAISPSNSPFPTASPKPELDGLDDTDSNFSMPEPDFEIFSMSTEVSMGLPELSVPSEPTFEEFDGLDDSESSMSLPKEEITVVTLPEEETFDWWLDGESMPYGDSPELSMSIPVDPHEGESYHNDDDAEVLIDDGDDEVSDHSESYHNDVCLLDGNVITCEGAPEGEAVYVYFAYNVETSEVDPEHTVSSLESAILAAVVDYVSSPESSNYGITRLSSSPKDYISDGVFCPPYDCSHVLGEMTVYADSHTIDACDFLNVLQASMENADFSDIEGVQLVEYLNSVRCVSAFSKVSGEALVTDDGLSTGTIIAFAMLAAFVVSVANKFLLERKLRKERDAGDSG